MHKKTSQLKDDISQYNTTCKDLDQIIKTYSIKKKKKWEDGLKYLHKIKLPTHLYSKEQFLGRWQEIVQKVLDARCTVSWPQYTLILLFDKMGINGLLN